MSAPHTPGPWEEVTPADGLWPPRVFAGSKIIAMVDNSDMTQSEKRANARLIAAAPDMLEALRGLLALYQGQHEYRETTPEEIAAEHAIAKATGETK